MEVKSCNETCLIVGTSINIEHRAATGIGSRVRAEAVLESFDGRFYTLTWSARDEFQEIGRGDRGASRGERQRVYATHEEESYLTRPPSFIFI
jgi:predicted thioesterase